MVNPLGEIYDRAHANQLEGLSSVEYGLNPLQRIVRRYQAGRIEKAVGREFLKARDQVQAADEQGAVVNEMMAALGMYDRTSSVREKTDITFGMLRAFAHHCEPAAAIIEKRVSQVSNFCTAASLKRGRSENPGFRIKMTHEAEEATPADVKLMAEITHFFANAGYVAPPKRERPEGWQPGLEPFIKGLLRDSMTFDWAGTRIWKSAKDPKKYPVVAFAAVDGALLRRVRKPIKGLTNGVIDVDRFEGERTNTKDEIEYVIVNQGGRGGMPMEEYTEDEIAPFVRNQRTDRDANGYGYSELERAINCITGWLYAREYNVGRFRKDSLPRGFLTLMGAVDEQQLTAFQLRWKQLMEGVGKRWAIPVLKGINGSGGNAASALWTPMDMSSRDMEYSHFMFMLALWLHAIFQMHPDETGYQALSPFRPPLAEASPESKLKYSQDTGLAPILRCLQTYLNHDILYKNWPSRRYSFEFVGVGEYDALVDAQIRMARLQSGLSTPRMEWSELDQPFPDWLKNHPVIDLPMPIPTGLQFLQQMEGLQLQLEAQKMQMMQMATQQRATQMAAVQQSRMGAPQPGAPMGAVPAGGAPPQQDVPIGGPQQGQGEMNGIQVPGQQPGPGPEQGY